MILILHWCLKDNDTDKNLAFNKKSILCKEK